MVILWRGRGEFIWMSRSNEELFSFWRYYGKVKQPLRCY